MKYLLYIAIYSKGGDNCLACFKYISVYGKFYAFSVFFPLYGANKAY